VADSILVSSFGHGHVVVDRHRRATTDALVAATCSYNFVDPSMSVNNTVTVPVGTTNGVASATGPPRRG